jgi:hypothetical protein
MNEEAMARVGPQRHKKKLKSKNIVEGSRFILLINNIFHAISYPFCMFVLLRSAG